ncbi:unnamed protein product [Effrenium voratum]|uniref:Uncharacterized protein n=1 Tax=Effrenium voratum TaxID=2562239 RepID=A0AA36INQ2_9DINO|nr:unnamed protein product [Effrenium voratum]CAJ1391034.1 unnamed protein product [Effrenium voratum]
MDLSSTQISSDLSSLANNPQLQWLDRSSTQISGDTLVGTGSFQAAEGYSRRSITFRRFSCPTRSLLNEDCATALFAQVESHRLGIAFPAERLLSPKAGQNGTPLSTRLWEQLKRQIPKLEDAFFGLSTVDIPAGRVARRPLPS